MNIHPTNAALRDTLNMLNNQAIAEVQRKLVEDISRLEKELHNKNSQLLVLSCRGVYTDSDGYPNWQSRRLLEIWYYDDPEGALDFMQRLWNFPQSFKVEVKRDEVTGQSYKEYAISTMGWSSNEALIGALQNNSFLWSSIFVTHHKGGHYLLHVDIEDSKKDASKAV